MPLQQRLEKGVMYRPFLKTEQEYKAITSIRNIDRAVSLPLERKNYIHDYPSGEKERGYSMQRDQVNFDNISHFYIPCCIIYIL